MCAGSVGLSAPAGGSGGLAGCPAGLAIATGGGITTVLGGGTAIGALAEQNRGIARAASIRTAAISAGCSASSF
jgi:hypothetical protein